MKPYRTYLLLLAVTLMSGLSLSAATSIWDGDTDSLWTTAANWDTAPAGGEDIVFPSVANQTVDLTGVTPSIATLTFNSPTAYSLINGGPGLTLGGDVTQSGAGSVALNVAVDLGGANRNFGGAGSGVVSLNGPVTDTAATGNRVVFTGGNWVITNSANTVDRFIVTNGAKVTFVGSSAMAAYPNPSYFGGNGAAGGYWITADGGVLDWRVTEVDTGYGGATLTTTMLGDWSGHGIIFGPNGGTLLLNKDYPVSYAALYQYSYATNGTPGTIVLGEPLPFTGDGRNDNWRGPFDVELGGGIAGDFNVGANQRRFGEGDLSIVVTNGATAYLDWSVMTNGFLRVYGQPGGDSSVIETNALGTTKNVGRFLLRGPHRGTQYTDETIPVGAITKSIYINQPWGMQFYDAVQIWNRDGPERFACDMSFESGSSVDICSGKWTRYLDLGHIGNGAASIAGPTNTITIKSGGKLNLNVQMRSCQWEGNGPVDGEASGVRVFAKTIIQDGGQLRLYRSQNNATRVKSIEFFRDITGQGSSTSDAVIVVELPYAVPNQFNRDASGGNAGGPGVNLDTFTRSDLGGNNTTGIGPWNCGLVVNGSSRYGFKLVGNNSYIDNIIGTPGSGATKNRMESLSGTGGVLTLNATNTSGQMTLSSGPTNGNPTSIRLGFIGDLGHTYIVNPGTITNFAGLLVKAARVKLGNGLDMTGKNLRTGDDGAAVVALDDAATATMNQLVLVGDTALEMGTAGGSAAVLNLANSSSAAWTAGKTLTVKYWNGNTAGGGPDQIFFGTDATGLSAGQLAQIEWIAPNGGADVTGAQILPTGEIVPLVVAQPNIGAPALIGGNIVFDVVAGSPSQVGVVQCATNLNVPITWVNVVTNTGNFSFTNSANLPEAYYRVLVQ